jgi:hypothetical protein
MRISLQLIEIIALTMAGNPDFQREDAPDISLGANPSEVAMGKGNNRRGNKEVKKPKQEKSKASATAGTALPAPISLGEKKKTK